MKNTCYLFTFLIIFFYFPIHAQNDGTVPEEDDLPFRCVVDHYHDQKMNNDPVYKLNFEQRNEQIYNIVKKQMEQRKLERNNPQRSNNAQSPCTSAPDAQIMTVPIVIYIVHLSSEPNPGDGPSNPTDAQILDGIQHLNDAFRNVGAYAGHGVGASDPTNPDAALLESVDVEIEFCLAKRTINGTPTSGIFRIESDQYSDIDIDTEITDMKNFVEAQVGVGLFPDSDYAGTWLFNQICGNSTGLGCGIGGYAGPSLGVFNLVS